MVRIQQQSFPPGSKASVGPQKNFNGHVIAIVKNMSKEKNNLVVIFSHFYDKIDKLFILE